MTAPTNHTVTVINKFGNTITTHVVYVKPLNKGQAEVHVETTYHIELGYSNPATYVTPRSEAKGSYKVHDRVFTVRQTYVYKGVFTRE